MIPSFFKRKKGIRTSLLLLGALLGIFLTTAFKKNDPYFEINKNLEIFASAFKKLNLYYVDKTEPGELMKSGIDAMLSSLDPYTQFIPESRMEDHRLQTTGEYGGIGASIRKRGDYVMIVEPYEGFPAQKSGIMAGDRIVEVKGRSMKGHSTNQVSEILKGQAGTKVSLKVKRRGKEKAIRFELKRERVQVPSVPYKGMVGEELGYLKLRSFTRGCSGKVEEAIKELKDQGMKRLVFDLRGNGGGLLKEAVKIVNLFVPKGQLVVSTKGRTKEWNKSYRALNDPLDTNMRVAVLVDGRSASASEIVSGCIQDLDRGVVIGRRTLGKGLVQQTQDLSYNSKIKLTVAKYYIPSGRCIQEVDYSKEDKQGHAKNVPDSLVESYRTENGRKVLDARGIHPDVKVPQKKRNAFLKKLVRDHHIFDKATRFRLAVDSIGPASEFQVPDSSMEAFKQELRNKEIDYRTRSSKRLKKLKKTAKKEAYFENAKTEYQALKKALSPDKKRDIERFSEEIRQLLLSEIISRYHYQKGSIRASLRKDRALDSAKKVINTARYDSILAPPSGYMDSK
ncbi:MAG: S41 family peptidase [Flavobacteriales bacterium]